MADENTRAVFRLTQPALIWLGIACMLIGIGWYKGINLMLLLGYFQLALVGVNAMLAGQMVLRVRARREPLEPVFAGEPMSHVVHAVNPTGQEATVQLTDPVSTQSAQWLFSSNEAGREYVLRQILVIPGRGVYPVGPIQVESAFPLGLISWRAECFPEDRLTVLPRPGHVELAAFRQFLARYASGEGTSRRPSRRQANGMGDLRGVRPFRQGDTPRDIHWRTSARRGQLMVREYDQTDPLNLVLILDPSGPDTRHQDGLEWACELTISLAWAWATADEPGELTFVMPNLLPGGPPEVRTGRASLSFIRAAFAPLASVQFTSVPVSLSPRTVRPNSPRTARVVVSAKPGGELGEYLRRQGVPIVSLEPGMVMPWYHPPQWDDDPS